MAIPRLPRLDPRSWIAGTLLLGCAACTAGDGALAASPSSLITTPSREETSLELHNRGDTAVSLSSVRLAGKDWDGFVILGDEIPAEVPAGGSVELRVRASTTAFREADADGDFLGYTSASARLDYRDGGARKSVALEFAEPSAWRSQLLPSILVTIVFAVIAWLALHVRRRRERAPGSGAPSVAAITTSLIALAFMPLGDAICPSELGRLSSDAALAQCREGLGGAPLQALTLPASLLIWLAVMALGPVAAMSVMRQRGRTAELTRASMLIARSLVVALVLTALVVSVGSLDVHSLALAQAERFDGLPLPRWGALTQPLGFALLLTCAASDRAAMAVDHRAAGSGGDATLRQHAWSAMAAALYLGAWHLPNWAGHGSVSHGALLVIGIAALVIKWALVHKVISVIAGWRRFARAAANGDEVRTLVRWLIPLALLNLFGSLLVG